GDNNRVGWSYIKADGTKAYCKYQIKVKYACPTNSKTPNNTDNLVISDPCEGVSYSHVIANLRENGVPYPDENDCFKWVYNPNADITNAATALPADGNIRLLQGDNNRVGWSYIKADGTKAYCKYQIKVKYACPTNPKSPNNTDKIEVADPCVGIPYADVVELLRGNGVIFPNEGDCLKWAYNPSANISNAATALPVESNLNLLPGLVRLGFSYLKADGSNGYCYLPVTVTYPCPVNPARNDRIFIHYLNDPCSGMDFSDAVNLVRENGIDFPDESSCVKWLYHPTAAIGGSAQIADGSTPIKIGDGNRIGWSYIKADGNPAYCDIQFQAKYTCPTNPKKPINTDNLRLKDNSCGYTVGELVDILRGNGVDVPEQSDCVSWWYRPTANVDANNKFPATPETNLTVGDNNYFGWSFVRADGNLQFCAGYRFLIKCQNFDGGMFGANGNTSELPVYMSDETKCKVTGNDVIEQLKARRVYLPTIGDNCNVNYSLTYKQNNAVIANPVFDKGTANDFINYTFSLGAPTNYSASCNYKFKVDGSKACPISRLGEMEFSMGVDKEGVKAKLNEQLPIDFTDCADKSFKLVLDEGSLPADYPVGLVASVKWKVYANTSYQNYTCPQVIKVIDEAPIEINCSDVGVTRRDGDVSVFNMPELNLNGNACSSVDWVIRITDKEYNGNDITAATGAVVEGGKVKADLPLGYSYITYKATCGPRSATCSAKVFVAKDVETCK
ncbi:MAG: hypothetical protein MJZ23_08145, partial [Paludibacteraceae bacterium]|nr:hypothetical protein [Paludibacteraceae bacterium]